MRNYKYMRIKDFGIVVTGKTPSTEDESNFSDDFPFITPSDIPTFNEKHLLHTERGISQKAANKMKSIQLPKNSVCFVCIGSTIGKMCFTKEASFTNQQINSIIVNEKYDSQYIFYLLRYIRSYFQQLGAGTGSGKGIVNKSTFEKTKVQICNDKSIQKKIADILSTYDDLIENNNRRIALLEKAAQEIYKEWFVRFRFPGHETNELVNSRLGKIPSSFRVIKMNEAFDYHIGGGWGEDDCSETFSEKAYVIRGTDFPKVQKGDLSTCPLRYHKKSNYSSRVLKENDIIIEVSGGTAEQPVGRTLLVNKDVLDRLENKAICASFCKLIRLNTEVITPYYFYYWMQFLYNTRSIDRFQLQSTGIINFKFEYFLRKGDIMLPPKSLMKEFEIKVKSFYDEISLLAKQNENLIKQRDLLLPRLMSGKLGVQV